MYASAIALLAALSASAVAKTISIDVGETGLVFSPDSSTAAVGDVLEFKFYSTFHTVVQGDFSTPCQMGSLKSSGFASGPIKDKSSVFQVTVKSTDPIWFYCSVSSHCSSGMVGVVNPPSQGNTLDAYKSAAKSATSAQGPSAAQGGTLGAAGSDSSASSGAASGAATTASGSGSATAAATTAAATGSGTSAPSTASASTSAAAAASSKASATAAASPTSGGMALMETGDKVALTSVLVGLGLLAMLMV